MNDKMEITFWGARGSHPISNKDMLKYGGNTACVTVDFGDGKVIILDAGTGIINYADELRKSKTHHVDFKVFFTHVHWDHILGIPFFSYIYDKKSNFSIYGEGKMGKSLRETLGITLQSPYFPVQIEHLTCNLNFHEIENKSIVTLFDNVAVEAFATDHPNGNLAYKISYNNKSFVHLTDLEHRENHKELVEFVKDVDVLSYDCHFTPEEYNSKKYFGWGHSTYENGANLAKEANVKQFVIFHHAPFRIDLEVLEIENKTKEIFSNSIAAFEGLKINL